VYVAPAVHVTVIAELAGAITKFAEPVLPVWLALPAQLAVAVAVPAFVLFEYWIELVTSTGLMPAPVAWAVARCLAEPVYVAPAVHVTVTIEAPGGGTMGFGVGVGDGVGVGPLVLTGVGEGVAPAVRVEAGVGVRVGAGADVCPGRAPRSHRRSSSDQPTSSGRRSGRQSGFRSGPEVGPGRTTAVALGASVAVSEEVGAMT